VTVPFLEVGAVDHLRGVTIGQYRDRAHVVQITIAPAYGTIAAFTLDFEGARQLRDQLTAMLEAAA
jgi:hypothetical protein